MSQLAEVVAKFEPQAIFLCARGTLLMLVAMFLLLAMVRRDG
jgi:hypothetical protein